MSGKTGIEWTDVTWNPVVGCEKVSQGCKFCYAKTVHDRRHKAFLQGKSVAPQYSMPFEMVQLKPERLRYPLSLREPSRIFVNSVSDLFHDDVPDAFIADVFAVMAEAERHQFQVLTKRPARMLHWFTHYLDEACSGERPAEIWPLPNVWLGVSVENQAAADERIPLLLRTPAAVHFLSCEPLLGPVDLRLFAPFIAHLGAVGIACEHGYDACPICDRGIDWVIAGGESGVIRQDVRPMHPAWARSIRDQCVASHVPFLFKQSGDWVHSPGPVGEMIGEFDVHVFEDGTRMGRVGKKRAGRLLDGRLWDEYPKVAR